MQLSPAQAAQELIRRLDAESSLIAFTEYTNDHYVPAPHHRLIAEKLEAVERGEVKRLMIFMPPRHGKSELASRRFPAWYLGRNRRKQIIAGTYNGDFAGDFGREVRNIISDPSYGAVFEGLELAPDSQAANRWHTNAGGAYVAAGVGTAVTGRGADILLIDDPIKDREEADSELKRQRVWDWYTSTAYTRLMPGGAVILIQTRWHDDDLAGRLLEQMHKGGEQWEVLSLKALGDNGKALWPEWYDEEALARIKGVVGNRDWSALYQQEPVPESGNFFRREWVRWYENKPAHMRIYGASDYATKDGDGDWTVHVVAGVDPNDDIYILDCWREQTDSMQWIDAWCDLVIAYKPLEWAEEAGQIRASLDPFIKKRSLERQAYTYRNSMTSVADKPSRAQAFRGRMAMGKVYWPKDAPWVDTMLNELLRFPSAKNDDQVDSLSLLGRLLDRMSKGQVPEQPTKPKYLNEATFNDLLEANKVGQRKRTRI